jgi:hypothetical protein
MLRGIVATVLVAGVATIGATASASAAPAPEAPITKRCIDFGPGVNRCRVVNNASKVSAFVVRLGQRTHGRYRLHCEKGAKTFNDRGRLARHGFRIVPIPLKDATCHSVVVGVNRHGKFVRAVNALT